MKENKGIDKKTRSLLANKYRMTKNSNALNKKIFAKLTKNEQKGVMAFFWALNEILKAEAIAPDVNDMVKVKLVHFPSFYMRYGSKHIYRMRRSREHAWDFPIFKGLLWEKSQRNELSNTIVTDKWEKNGKWRMLLQRDKWKKQSKNHITWKDLKQ